jgi:hypothetical protein
MRIRPGRGVMNREAKLDQVRGLPDMILGRDAIGRRRFDDADAVIQQRRRNRRREGGGQITFVVCGFVD